MRNKLALAGLLTVFAVLALPNAGSASVTNTRITSGPSGTIPTDSATFTFTSPEDGGFECRLDSQRHDGWDPCASPKSYSSLADGPHTFEVRALNRAGNPDPTPAVRIFTVDTDDEPPETTITVGPSGTVATGSAIFGFESTEPGSFECRLDPSGESGWGACASGLLYSLLADGPHSFEVRATDDAGNTDPTPATAAFAVDTKAPETTITERPTGTIATGSATFGFESTEPGGFECRLDSDDPGDWSACTSPRSYSGLADGPHTFEVRASDQLGNTDQTPAEASFAVDTTPPETTITDGPGGTVGSASVTFAFASTEAGGFQCRLDSDDAGAWGACSSPRSYPSLADGPHAFEVRAGDRLGNTDPTPAVATFAVSTGPPDPIAGQTLNLVALEGNVQLQCPGEDSFSRLVGFRQVPVGCLINARNGVVDLTASKGSSGELQGAHFWAGVFIASQAAGDNQKVDLKLAGRRMCERRGSAKEPAARASRRSKGGRRVWGSGNGNYSTRGSYGSATVRGTTWLVVDRCDSSTLFRVSDGSISVRDFVEERTLALAAGEQYIAKASIPRLNLDALH